MSSGTDPSVTVTVSASNLDEPTLTPTSTLTPESWSNSFSDVNEGNWFYSDVQYVVGNDLFDGTTTTTFSPSSPMTRGMVVTVLWRLAGSPSTTSSTAFSDVPSGAWYSDAVAWAVELGIVNGIGDGLFSPGGNISRQDLAVTLMRYAEQFEVDLPQTRSTVDFTDANEISGYAVDAVTTLYAAGIINGTNSGAFDPKGQATRAEVAAMLHRFCEAIQ